jgi:hypothetical protein
VTEEFCPGGLLIVHISDRLIVDVDQKQVKWRETDATAVNIREYMTCIPMWADITWSWDLGVDLSLATYSLATYLFESRRGSSLATSPAR